MIELVDFVDSKSSAFGRGGSNPPYGTNLKIIIDINIWLYGGDLASTGIVGAVCMSDWAIPLRGLQCITANNTDYRPAYAVA